MSDKEEVKKAPTFTRDQLAGSKRFRGFEDLINAYIGDDEKLTMADAVKRIKETMKAKVK